MFLYVMRQLPEILQLESLIYLSSDKVVLRSSVFINQSSVSVYVHVCVWVGARNYVGLGVLPQIQY